MSGHFNNYYSSTSRGTRDVSSRQDRGGERKQELPSIRDVLPEQFEDPHNFLRTKHKLPPHSHGRGSTNLLPPIQEHSATDRQSDYGYNRPAPYLQPLSQRPSRDPSANVSFSTTSTGDPVYHVFAPSHERDRLIAVSESYSKPPGIVRENILSLGTYDNDSKKKFECNICGRRMERQSVYNQHLLTHTGERRTLYFTVYRYPTTNCLGF
ncbi:hypothetical protein BU17DRAFT_90735 [Hysterangium stoloniferum]|nr:hypothetical protein BU17DRAFT_90735 [Hysterangium stoloniferum]